MNAEAFPPFELAVLYVPKIYQDIMSVDKKIEAAVGKTSWAGGYGFGQRDICFNFVHRHEASAAQKRVLELDDVFEMTTSIKEREPLP